ncbi:murein hydrolase activator NlpD [Gilliamella sp. W8126]|uniref:Murein hydrolase activator NlpD n=1 Tax=Gilliamella apis TaxID=1970738 RepID=A0A2V4DMJ5_9GAMM|nr:murein hydrolase activator NlpD [Gilliamella sp. W8126]MBI0005011.1 murein hydrolase activator NlpD [Gilliamella sp. W8126]PXY90631.1 murein hydrolase activator NlpD [Gilliamella apis]
MKGVIVKKILTLSCLSLMIAACTQTNPAQIEDISDSSSCSTSSVYSKPPANISTGTRSSSQIYSSSTPTTSRSPVTANNNSTRDSQSVVTSNERIVYNRDYNDIPKGGYQGDTYTVKRGDTLFYIAWVTGNDYRALAAKNNIKEPFAVNVGQVLDVSGGTTVVETKKTTSTMPVVTTNNNNNGSVTNTTTKTKPVVTTVTTTTTTTSGKNKPTNTIQTTETVTEPVDTAVPTKLPTTSNVANIVWQWPAQGKIIEKFSNASKGIDISGNLGAKVVAAANGRVVYSGNALPGYGNLIIIKHNDDYLTAYAHNQTILVKEQQNVRAGEQIATMGATGTSSVRLHFEIRYKAQSVDPLKYLPTK